MSIAVLHLDADTFWHHITPIELGYAFKTHNKKLEKQQQFDMEVMRLQTMLLLNQNIKPAHQFRDPKKLMRFYWEKVKPEEIEIWEEEDWQQMDKKIGTNK